jgi:DNA polymerase-1
MAPEGVTVVADKETARKVVAILMTLKDRVHACDTETIGFTLSKSPVGHGKIICASIYCGPDVDFGKGPRIWIDNLGSCEGVLNEFAPFFESEEIKKIWHHYAFDRHQFMNHGIKVKGFGGDTMQMARLWDSSRIWLGGYSLAGLINDLGLDSEKRNIKDRFGSQKMKKDGTVGKAIVLPSFAEIQRSPHCIQTNF